MGTEMTRVEFSGSEEAPAGVCTHGAPEEKKKLKDGQDREIPVLSSIQKRKKTRVSAQVEAARQLLIRRRGLELAPSSERHWGACESDAACRGDRKSSREREASIDYEWEEDKVA